MGKISVNQTRGHQCYKLLLVFFLCRSVRSSLSPVLTLFMAQPACSKLGPPRKATPSPSGNEWLDQVSRYKWPSILNKSDWETSGTILTSLQQGEWITSRLSTPSPHCTNKEVPGFFMSRVFPTSSITPLWSVRSTMGVFSQWWRRRSNYGITKYHSPTV